LNTSLLVSIIISCYFEEYIAQCMDSLLADDYTRDRLDVLVVDGISTYRTSDILILDRVNSQS
jgi:glycosyltransferase involved in cell wall biosynthesis